MVLIYDNNQRLLIVKSETLENSFSLQQPCYDKFISTETFLAMSNFSSPLGEDSFFQWACWREGVGATHHRTGITCLPPSHFFPSWMILGQLLGLSAYVGSVRSRSVMVTLSCMQARARVRYIYIDIDTDIHTHTQPACVPSPFSLVWLFVTLWTVDHQAPLSMG